MKNNKGFSLVELIVVIAIMAILAAVAIPTFAHFINKANLASDQDFAAGVEYAVNMALAGEAEEAAWVKVEMNKDTKKISKITYSTDASDTTGVIAVNGGTVVTQAAGTANKDKLDRIAAAIADIVDTDYVLKTDGSEIANAKVTVTIAQ